MIITEQINSKLQRLPALYQQEVLHFIEFLSQKAMQGEAETEEKLWTDFSLTKEKWRKKRAQSNPSRPANLLNLIFQL